MEHSQNFNNDRQLKMLVIKGFPIEDMPSDDGVFTLYGCEGKCVEVFQPFNVKCPVTYTLCTDLDRLDEYASIGLERMKSKKMDNLSDYY